MAIDSTFELIEECAFTGTTSWRLKDNHIRFRRKNRAGGPLPSIQRVHVADEQFETFVAALDFLDVWNWKPDYDPRDCDCVVCDGMSWSFTASIAGRQCKTGGTNAYPSFADHQKTSLDVGRYTFLANAIDSMFHLGFREQPKSDEITLNSGRWVILEELDQQLTYADLIDGAPFAEANDHNVQAALETARAKCVNDVNPVLLVPDRRSYFREPGDMNNVRTVGKRRPEWLPRVRCIGSFKSVSPAHNQEMDGSHLVVVWYQEEFGPPNEGGVLPRIQSIDWEASAVDFEY